MLDINVKTLDGQNRSYSVPDDYTVRQFKEKITSSLNIPVENQRLIFQGRELKDNNKLNESDVNGKTLHLVQRAPPAASAPTTASSTPTNTSNNAGSRGGPDIQRLVNQLIGGFGQNVTGSSTTTTDINGMQVHIDINNASQQANENEIRSRIRNIRRFLSLAQSRLNRLQEINSGAPLEDTSGSIIIGSIHGTAQLSDSNGTLRTIGFDIPTNLNYAGIDIQNLIAQATGVQVPGADTGSNSASTQASTSETPANVQPIISANTTPSTNETVTESDLTPAQATPTSVPSTPTSTPAESVEQLETEETQATESSSTTQQETANAMGSETSQNISVEVLADVIQSVMTSYSTFLPYLQQYHEMLINDINEPPESPTPAGGESTSNLNLINNSNILVLGGGDNNRRQRFCNNINDMMHLLGHLFHNLSDLHINIRDRPPRQMHTMTSMQHSASVISGRPVEANIQIPLGQAASAAAAAAAASASMSASATGTNANPTATSTAPAPGSTASSLPRSPFSVPRLPHNHHHHPHVRPHVHHHSHVRPHVHHHHVNHMAPRTRSSHSFSHAPQQAPQPVPQQHRVASQFGTTPQQTPQAVHMNAHRFAHEAAVAAARGRALGMPHGQAYSYRLPFSNRPGMRPERPATPGGLPFQMPSSLGSQSAPVSSYDPYLPCNSVHFYNTVTPAQQASSQRRRHPAGDQHNSPPTTSTTTNSSTTTTSSTPLVNSQGQTTNVPISPLQNNDDIGRLISNVISQISGNPSAVSGNQEIQVNIGSLPGQISIGTLQTSTSDPTEGASANTGNLFNIEQVLSGLGAGIPIRPTGVDNTNPLNSSAQAVNSLIRDAINLMDSNNTNDQRLNQPLTGLLGMSFGDDEEEEGWRPDSSTPPTSTLSIFNVLFSSMTLGDMINLARGSSRDGVFERSRQPLREHIKKYFLTPQSSTDQVLTEENQAALVERMYREVFIDQNGLNIDLTQFELIDSKVDFPASFENLIKHHLKILLKHVYDTTYDDVTYSGTNSISEPGRSTWSSILFKKFNDLIEKIVLLSRFCVKNADSKFTQVVTQKLRQAVVSQNMVNNQMFFNIFENFIQTQVQQTLTSITTPTENSNIREFVIYKGQSVSTGASTSAAREETMTMVEDEDVYDSASSTLSDMDIDQSFNEYKKKNQEATKQYEKKVEETRQEKCQPETASKLKTTTWKNNVPTEWITDLEKDIEKQRDTVNPISRGPFSDAYCSAMPAKRRKIYTIRSDMQDKSIFKQVLNRTINKIQMKQNANVEQLVETSLANSQLIESFSNELNTNINERLKKDEDFKQILKKQEECDDAEVMDKDRFSNSKKRFK